MTQKLNTDNGLQARRKRTTGYKTRVWQKWRFRAPYDSFVGNQTLVFEIKFCSKSLALRVAAKRYGQFNETTINTKMYEKIGSFGFTVYY